MVKKLPDYMKSIVHYRVHKIPLLGPIKRQFNLEHASALFIFRSCLGLPDNLSLPLRIFNQNFYAFLILQCMLHVLPYEMFVLYVDSELEQARSVMKCNPGQKKR
jgi:hypothetical protein